MNVYTSEWSKRFKRSQSIKKFLLYSLYILIGNCLMFILMWELVQCVDKAARIDERQTIIKNLQLDDKKAIEYIKYMEKVGKQK